MSGYIQSNSALANPSVSHVIDIPFLSNVTAGSLLTIGANGSNFGGFSAITDTLGNTYTTQFSQGAGTSNELLQVWTCISIASGANSIHGVVIAGGFGFTGELDLIISEHSGYSLIDVIVTDGFGNTGGFTVTPTLAQANELLLIWVSSFFAGASTITPSTGWVQRQTIGGGSQNTLWDQIYPSSGSVTFTIGGAYASTGCVGLIAFKQAIIITCGSPPEGTVTSPPTAYSHTFPITGGTGPYTFAITVGSLPPGLSLNTSTGVVSGNPTTGGDYPFTIQVTDSLAATASVACEIDVLQVICNSPPSGSVGIAYSHGFPAAGGSGYTFAISAGSIPTGTTLNTSTGVVSGTPTTPGTFSFTVQVTDALATVSAVACSISIASTLAIGCDSPPSGSVGVSYSHAFPASNGTPPYTFAIISGALPTGLTLNASTGVASGTPTTPGTFSFTVQVTDNVGTTASVGCSIIIISTLAIICNNPPAGQVGVPYSHAFPASGGTPPYTFAIISGSLPTGLALNTSTGVVSGTPTGVGTFAFTIQVTDSVGTTANVGCSIVIFAGLGIICDSPPAGLQGTAYTHTFPASGGTPPYTFAITSGSLPTGLSLDTGTGIVSGTPTIAGLFAFTITVTDAIAATASVGCTINILSNLAIACNNPPGGTVGIAYTHTFPATGGTPPYAFAIIAGALPPGLTLNSSTGVLSGTPITGGTYFFTIQVTDVLGNTASVACSIVIAGSLAIICDNPPPGIVGQFYSHTFPISGGVPPYTFTISAGSLPPGLTLTPSSGVISGTPTKAGIFAFTVMVTDAMGATATCSITIGTKAGILTARLFRENAPSKMEIPFTTLTATFTLYLRLSPLNTTDTTPIDLMLFKNGALLTGGGLDYTKIGPWVTLTVSSQTTDLFIALISMGGTACSTHDGSITGAINGTNATFTLPQPATQLMLFANGLLLTETCDYQRVGTTGLLLSAVLPINSVLTAEIYLTLGPTQVTTCDGTLVNPTAAEAFLFRNGLMMTQTTDGVTAGNAAAFSQSQTPQLTDIVTVQAWTQDISDPNMIPLNLAQQFTTNDGTIAGVLDGSNNQFTVVTDSLVTEMLLSFNGLEMTESVDYTWACLQNSSAGPWTTTITMQAGNNPNPDDVLTAQVFST